MKIAPRKRTQLIPFELETDPQFNPSLAREKEKKAKANREKLARKKKEKAFKDLCASRLCAKGHCLVPTTVSEALDTHQETEKEPIKWLSCDICFVGKSRPKKLDAECALIACCRKGKCGFDMCLKCLKTNVNEVANRTHESLPHLSLRRPTKTCPSGHPLRLMNVADSCFYHSLVDKTHYTAVCCDDCEVQVEPSNKKKGEAEVYMGSCHQAGCSYDLCMKCLYGK